MSEYIKTCKYCKQEIKMSDDSGKWNPYNKDGSAHDCRDKTNQPKQDTTTQQEITLQVVLRKLESIGVTIDLEKLKNATNGAMK